MKEHSKIYVGNLLIKMYYPNVITYLVNNLGYDEAKSRVFQIGRNTCENLLQIWKPKTRDVKKIVEEFWKVMWNTTKYIKIKQIQNQNKITYLIRDKRCGVCDPEISVEGITMPCVSVAGYLHACIEFLSKDTHLSSYKVETTKSVVSGDPYCEHQIEIVR